MIKLLFDGHCSICSETAARLSRLDHEHQIELEDISTPGFDPSRYGLTAEEVRTALSVVLPDGRVLRAMDAVRAAYAAVGRGWLLAPTAWPDIRPLADAFYRFFARHRMTFSRLLGRKCSSGSCSIHGR